MEIDLAAVFGAQKIGTDGRVQLAGQRAEDARMKRVRLDHDRPGLWPDGQSRAGPLAAVGADVDDEPWGETVRGESPQMHLVSAAVEEGEPVELIARNVVAEVEDSLSNPGRKATTKRDEGVLHAPL